jgi:V/A-type H+-transporting ATPase subunit E
MMSEVNVPASGVKELIRRIRDEGVEKAHKEAKQIVHEAKQAAAQILADAESKAKQELAAAREQISVEETASEEALKLAARDTVKNLGANVSRVFRAQLEKVIHEKLGDEALIKDVILAVASEAGTLVKKGTPAELLVHYQEGNEEEEKKINELIYHLSHEAFKEGLVLRPEAGLQRGVSIKVEGAEVQIDVNEETLTELMHHQLLPRYRQLLRSEHMKFDQQEK